MLTKCRECGKEVSTGAKACPHCGYAGSQDKPAGIPWGPMAVVVLGGLAVTYCVSQESGGGTSGPAADSIAASLLPKRVQCRHNLEGLQRLGVRLTTRSGAVSAEYDEAVWASLDHEDKVKQALVIYCAMMPDDGKYTVLIEGKHDGKQKAYLVDGNYFDD